MRFCSMSHSNNIPIPRLEEKAADYLAFPRNQYELKRIVTFANAQEIPWMVLKFFQYYRP